MVKISKPARNDLRQIYEFIARDSLYYAQEVIQQIILQIKQLEKFPNMGRVVQELNNSSIREIIHETYRIVYRTGEVVEVTAIIHAKRNFDEVVKNRGF